MPAIRDSAGRFMSAGGSAGGGAAARGGWFSFGAKVKVKLTPERLKRQVDLGTIWSLGRAGAYIRGIARKSIKISKDYSLPGQPPHSRKGQIKNAIRFDVEENRQNVVIGPTASGIGNIGHIQEFGGTYPPTYRGGKVRKYPARSFMGPALLVSKERLPKFWAQSVRGG